MWRTETPTSSKPILGVSEVNTEYENWIALSPLESTEKLTEPENPQKIFKFIFKLNERVQLPFGSYPITGLLLQYTYKLQPIGFDVSKYSTSSQDNHLYTRGL